MLSVTGPVVDRKHFFGPDGLKDLCEAIEAPFILEHLGRYEEAIEAHENAPIKLVSFVKKAKKIKYRFQRVMFERQMLVHKESRIYLDDLVAKGSFEGVVVLPTALTADADLDVKNGQQRTLSLVCNP